MAVLYNEPKNGSKFSSFYVMNWEEISSTLEFDELRFCKDDDFYYLYCNATKLTDIIKAKEKDWKFSPQLLSFEVARKPVSRSGKEANQYLVEKLVCYALDKLDESKAYRGFISLQHAGFLTAIIDGLDMQGKPCPEPVREQLAASCYEFTETESKLISAEEVKPKAKWSKSAAKVQTEYEKLGDRLKFMVDQLKLAGCQTEIKTVMDLEIVPQDFRPVIDWSILLMSK